uniref:Putative cytotoxin-like protein n=1 Tax=Ixodes ricinus TaxID=34613 RepID=A0A6B0V8E1_IXORI
MLNDRSGTMIIQALLHCFVVFSAALASNPEGNEPKVFNLTIAIKKFVKLFEEHYKTQVDWTDIQSENKRMKELFETKKFYIQVEGGTVKMSDPKTGHGNRSLLYANLYDNESNTTQTYTVTHTTMRKEKSSLKVSKGFTLGIETSGGVSLKEIFGLGGTFGAKYTSDNTTTDSQTKLKTFAVATGVNVPSKRTVRVEWFATTAQSDIKWTCDFTLSGYFAMGLNETFQGYKVLIVPAYYLALANEELEIAGPRHARFVAKGVFTKVSVPESDIYTNDVTDTLKKKTLIVSGRSRMAGEF